MRCWLPIGADHGITLWRPLRDNTSAGAPAPRARRRRGAELPATFRTWHISYMVRTTDCGQITGSRGRRWRVMLCTDDQGERWVRFPPSICLARAPGRVVAEKPWSPVAVVSMLLVV